MRKKVLAVMMSGLMVLSLTACGSKDKEDFDEKVKVFREDRRKNGIGLSGVYKDKELGATIKIVEENPNDPNSLAVMEFKGFGEHERTYITTSNMRHKGGKDEPDTIIGDYASVVWTDDDHLQVTSGDEEPWGNFERRLIGGAMIILVGESYDEVMERKDLERGIAEGRPARHREGGVPEHVMPAD